MKWALNLTISLLLFIDLKPCSSGSLGHDPGPDLSPSLPVTLTHSRVL